MIGPGLGAALAGYRALIPPSLPWGLRFFLSSSAFKRGFRVSITQPGLAGLILNAQEARGERSHSRSSVVERETELTGGLVERIPEIGRPLLWGVTPANRYSRERQKRTFTTLQGPTLPGNVLDV